MRSRTSLPVLDCSRPAVCLFWSLFGAVLAITAMSAQGVQNWASLLRVGSSNPLLHKIESELGPVVSPDPIGHDGQLYYLIARDPFATGSTLDALVKFDKNPPRYRYRRILYPLLAGGLGQFGGRATLFGMMLCVTFGMALATVATADLAFHLQLPGGWVFVAAFNIGALLSGMLLTADVLALGFALAGVALMVRRHLPWALLALVLAGLTKETYLLVPLSISAYQWRHQRRRLAMALALIPVLPMALWSVWVWTFIPAVERSTSHIGLPMTGLFTGLLKWRQFDGVDFIQLPFAAYAIMGFLAGGVMLVAGRCMLLRWVLAPWILLAGVASVTVWGIPTNAARAFPVLWPLSVLLLAERLRPSARSDLSSRILLPAQPKRLEAVDYVKD